MNWPIIIDFRRKRNGRFASRLFMKYLMFQHKFSGKPNTRPDNRTEKAKLLFQLFHFKAVSN